MMQQVRRIGPLSVRGGSDYTYSDYLAGTPSFVCAPREAILGRLRTAERARRIDASQHPFAPQHAAQPGGPPLICEAAQLALCGMQEGQRELSPRVHAGAQDHLLAAMHRSSAALLSPRGSICGAASPVGSSAAVREKRQLLQARPRTSSPRRSRELQKLRMTSPAQPDFSEQSAPDSALAQLRRPSSAA
eukprot:TRINITY_DN14650_c0_g2_i1.p2 TRINITY_DN14650_c0_g2~~TRINITY_DN14650_c0_g2_i1.p2  ORF type:complete len:190 (+),score=38.28 TRINITY_DN14650_c0_g2_i1:635-1204(+)